MAGETIVAHKGLDPVILEVKDLCSFADFFVIASGRSTRQVQALARHLEETLSGAGIKPLGVEGLEEGLWVLMDYNDVVIHLFYHPFREFYDLEGLWAEASRQQVPGSEAAPPFDAADLEADL